MPNIKGIQEDKENVTSKNDAEIYHALASGSNGDYATQKWGVFADYGENFTAIISGSNVTIRSGRAMLMGRNCQNLTNVDIPIPLNTTSKIIIKYDENKTPKSRFSIETKTASDSLIQQDLMNDGKVFEAELYTVTATDVIETPIRNKNIANISNVFDENVQDLKSAITLINETLENVQKLKLTNDDGNAKKLNDTMDLEDLDSGSYSVSSSKPINWELPFKGLTGNGILIVWERGSGKSATFFDTGSYKLYFGIRRTVGNWERIEPTDLSEVSNKFVRAITFSDLAYKDTDYAGKIIDVIISDIVTKIAAITTGQNVIFLKIPNTTAYQNLRSGLNTLLGTADTSTWTLIIEGYGANQTDPRKMTLMYDTSGTPQIVNLICNNFVSPITKNGDYVRRASADFDVITVGDINTRGSVVVGSKLTTKGGANLGGTTNVSGAIISTSSISASNKIEGKNGVIASSSNPANQFIAVGTGVAVPQTPITLQYSGGGVRLKWIDDDTSSPRVASLGYSASEQAKPNRGYSFAENGAFHINGTDNYKQLAYQSTMLAQHLEIVKMIEEQNIALSRDISKITLLKEKLQAELLESKINEALEPETIEASTKIQRKQIQLINKEVNEQAKLLSEEEKENGVEISLSDETINAINYELEQYAKAIKSEYEVKEQQIRKKLESGE